MTATATFGRMQRDFPPRLPSRGALSTMVNTNNGKIVLDQKKPTMFQVTPPRLPSRFLSPTEKSNKIVKIKNGKIDLDEKKPCMFQMTDQMLSEFLFDDYDSSDDESSVESSCSYLSLSFGDETFDGDDDDDSSYDSSSSDDSSVSSEASSIFSSSSSIQTRSSASTTSQPTKKSSMSLFGRRHRAHHGEASSHHHRQRHVRFASYFRIFKIPTLDEYSKKERKAMYLSQNELKRIRRDCHETIIEYERNQSSNGCSDASYLLLRQQGDTRAEYIRGLEKHMAAANARLIDTNEMLYASVFKVQNLRLPPGMIDKEGTIADICQNVSRGHVLEAQKSALIDARISFLEARDSHGAMTHLQ